MKRFLRLITPPIFIKVCYKLGFFKSINNDIIRYPKNENDKQDLDMYFDPEYSKVLDAWGENTTWIEIQTFLVNCSGKVLDIACGTGVTISIIKKYSNLDIYGCDISDLLIKKAQERGIKAENLLVTDATKMSYSNDFFDYSYSIGSLEHFTESGINKFIKEAARVTKVSSMHMIPTSKSGKNEGWMTTSSTIQTFYNNCDEWWMNKFKSEFKEVYMFNSVWNDGISYGRWFVCHK